MILFISGVLVGSLTVYGLWVRAESRHQQAVVAIVANHHATSFSPEVEAHMQQALDVARAEQRIPLQRTPIYDGLAIEQFRRELDGWGGDAS